MHYMTHHTLMSNDTSSARGTVRLQHNEQGRSGKQSLQIKLSGLEPNGSHDLTVVTGEDTNAVVVGSFTADANGRARLSFMSKGQGGGGKNPLPSGLSPLTDVRAIGIDHTGTNTNTVAHVWIADAEKYQYLVKRNLTPEDTNGTAQGSISLIANQNKVSFRLLAGGLTPTNDYHLVLNSNVVLTVPAAETGRLEITNWPDGAPAVLELRELAIWDAGSNVVLRTSLPR
jgi:hypothetical protein